MKTERSASARSNENERGASFEARPMPGSCLSRTEIVLSFPSSSSVTSSASIPRPPATGASTSSRSTSSFNLSPAASSSVRMISSASSSERKVGGLTATHPKEPRPSYCNASSRSGATTAVAWCTSRAAPGLSGAGRRAPGACVTAAFASTARSDTSAATSNRVVNPPSRPSAAANFGDFRQRPGMRDSNSESSCAAKRVGYAGVLYFRTGLIFIGGLLSFQTPQTPPRWPRRRNHTAWRPMPGSPG